jgi:hypothetical protein
MPHPPPQINSIRHPLDPRYLAHTHWAPFTHYRVPARQPTWLNPVFRCDPRRRLRVFVVFKVRPLEVRIAWGV